MNHLRLLVYKGRPNRFVGQPGHRDFKDFLYATLNNYRQDETTTVTRDKFLLNTDLAIEHYENDFLAKIVPSYAASSAEYKKWHDFKSSMQKLIRDLKNHHGENIIWQKEGKQKDKILVLTAHYDTVTFDKTTLKINPQSNMPGADYNASGVAILLGLIDRLYNQSLEYTVRIVFLDAQAIGYLGSYDYAQKMKKEKEAILGVLNLEMLGHDSKHFDKNKREKNYKAYLRSEKNDSEASDLEFLNYLERPFKTYLPDISFEKNRNDFKMSDQFRFWDVGIPAITLTQNWEADFNPKFQTENDFPETLNQSSLYAAFQYVATITLTHLLDIKQ
jgi:Zn-dependent M28 family amino/carboxypeptidase